ncbi:MAG: class I SAM-dependent methyltransferase [bacterium]|nr:class I SAM-dependent methyltransferase [bacterium]
MTDFVISPISKKPATLVQSVEVPLIIDLYRNQIGLNVSKYFGKEKQISIYECCETKYRFYFPFTVSGDSEFYAELQKKGDYYPEWKWENESALQFITSTSRVLDVGCGEGNFLKELTKRDIKNCCGIDQSLASLTYTGTNEIPIYDESIQSFSAKNRENFDVITCFQILEHITDVSTFIESCLTCLKPGGYLVVAVPNNNPYLYKHDLHHALNLPPHHTGLWNSNSLSKLTDYFGFKIVLNKVEPISQYIAEYTSVQMRKMSNSNAVLSWLFSLNIIRKVYSKLLYMFKTKIKGRNCLAVYQKNNNSLSKIS